MKKFFNVLLVVVVLCSLCVPANAEEYKGPQINFKSGVISLGDSINKTEIIVNDKTGTEVPKYVERVMIVDSRGNIRIPLSTQFLDESGKTVKSYDSKVYKVRAKIKEGTLYSITADYKPESIMEVEIGSVILTIVYVK